MKPLIAACRFHIFALAGIAAWVFSDLYAHDRLWGVGLWAGFDWLILNLLNRIADVKEDAANRIFGTDFVSTNQQTLFSAISVLLVGSFVLNAVLTPELLAPRALFHLFGMLYSFSAFGVTRLKDVWWFKNLASGILFLITSFLYGLITIDFHITLSWAGLLWFALYFLLFELSYEVLYDLRDIEGDSQTRVDTFATRLGPEKTLVLIFGLQFFSCAALLSGYALGFLPTITLLFLGGPVFIAGWIGSQRDSISSRLCTDITLFTACMLVFFLLWQDVHTPLSLTEKGSFVLIASYLFFQRESLDRFFGIALIAWLAEQSMISFYGFYAYSDSWLKLSDVPVMVPFVWAFLIETARKIAGASLPLFFALIVADALFVETIATQSGFWIWSVTGGFSLFPVVGVLGWGLFALGVRLFPNSFVKPLFFVHFSLLTFWWSCFRWIPEVPFAESFFSLVGALFALLLINHKFEEDAFEGILPRTFAAALFGGVAFWAKTPILFLAFLVLPYAVIVAKTTAPRAKEWLGRDFAQN